MSFPFLYFWQRQWLKTLYFFKIFPQRSLCLWSSFKIIFSKMIFKRFWYVKLGSWLTLSKIANKSYNEGTTKNDRNKTKHFGLWENKQFYSPVFPLAWIYLFVRFVSQSNDEKTIYGSILRHFLLCFCELRMAKTAKCERGVYPPYCKTFIFRCC